MKATKREELLTKLESLSKFNRLKGMTRQAANLAAHEHLEYLIGEPEYSEFNDWLES